MDNSYATQFATVNLNGKAAEVIRAVMRQTGWTVEQSLAHIMSRVVDRYETNNNLTEVGDLAIESNKVGVQVVKNTITASEFKVGDVVKVTMDIEEEDEVKLELVGIINGFAPQGVGVTLTNNSIAEAESWGVHVNKDDIWSYEDLTVL